MAWESGSDTRSLRTKQRSDYTSPILFLSRTLESAGLAAHNSAEPEFRPMSAWGRSRREMAGKANWNSRISQTNCKERWEQLHRTLRAAWWVRRALRGAGVSPGVRRAIEAAEKAYLPPQAGWRGADPRQVQRWAARLVRFPRRWGRCVQESLIVYRTLNGYGIPATFCLGLSPERPSEIGHAWVELISLSQTAELLLPQEPFLIVYRSPHPATPSIPSQQEVPLEQQA